MPEVMNEDKRQIDHAYDLALGDAMTYEVDICRHHRGPGLDRLHVHVLGRARRDVDDAAVGEGEGGKKRAGKLMKI